MKERICSCCGKAVIIGHCKTLTIEKESTSIAYFLCSEACLSKKIEELSKEDIIDETNKTFSIRHV